MQDIVALVPAAGKGTRLGPLPCSKEILPIGLRRMPDSQQWRPKVVGHYLLDHFREAGIERAMLVINKGKWDIPEYFGNGKDFGVALSYLIAENSPATPVTLDAAYAYVKDKICAMGFPDILFSSCQAYQKMLSGMDSNIDVVLGLFPTDHPEMVDMVNIDDSGVVVDIKIKPENPTALRYTWILAVWRPSFTRFMHEYLAPIYSNPGEWQSMLPPIQKNELFIGDVLQAAIEKGLIVKGVVVSGEACLDVGTPENLALAIERYGRQ